jgi:oxygen-dependent protoporphyrinogen oxidase
MLFQHIREHTLDVDLVGLRPRTLIVRDGRAVEVAPHSARCLLSYPHLSIGERLKLIRVTLRETLRRRRPDLSEVDLLAAFDDGTTASDWVRSRLSERILDNLVRPEIESRWLWRCDEVSAAHVVAVQASALGARFFVLRPGPEALAHRLAEGADLRLRTMATGVTMLSGRLRVAWRGRGGFGEAEEFDELVIATTAWAAVGFAAGLTGDAATPDLARFAATQRYEPVLSVAYLVDRGRVPSGAWIVPAGPGPHPARTIVTIPRRQGRRERELVSVYAGREETYELLGAGDECRFERARELARELWADFPRDAEPFHTRTWLQGLPWPEPGRYRLASMLGRLQHGPVVFAGDYLGSPTVESALQTGMRAARTLLDGGLAHPAGWPASSVRLVS